jgi:hypothetical protein
VQDDGMPDPDTELTTLWRPTGPQELALVEESGWKRWPPRLPEQPIFYPVLNEDYATKIARDWNVPASGVGYVTRFQVRRSFLDAYEVHQVGGQTILEYWIPAEDLDGLNANIVGAIELRAQPMRSLRRGARHRWRRFLRHGPPHVVGTCRNPAVPSLV